MENSIIARSWSSVKLFIGQNFTENANGDVPLIVEKVWYFQFLWVQGAHIFFLSKSPGTQTHFFEIFSKFKYFGNILSMLHEE